MKKLIGTWSRAFSITVTLLALASASYGVSVQGHLDHVSLFWVEGWSCDAANSASNVTVEIFATGTNGDGTCIVSPVPACRVGSGTASFRRESAVAASCGGNSSRGFRIPTSMTYLRDATDHNVYAFANIGGARTLLTATPFAFNSLTLYSQEPIYNIDDHVAPNAHFFVPESEADRYFMESGHTIAYYWEDGTIIPHTDPSFPAPTPLSNDIGAATGFSPPNPSTNQRKLGWTTASSGNGVYVDNNVGPGIHPNAFQTYGDTFGFLYDSRANGHPNGGVMVQHGWASQIVAEDRPRPWRNAGLNDKLRFEGRFTQPQVFPDPVTSSPGDVSFWYYVFFLNDRSRAQTPASSQRAIWLCAYANQSRIAYGTADPMVQLAWLDTQGMAAYVNTPIASIPNGWLTPCPGSAHYSMNPPATEQTFCFDIGTAQLTDMINRLNTQIAVYDAANPGVPFGQFSVDLANYELQFSLINAEAWGPGGAGGIQDADRIALSARGMKISNIRDPATNYAPYGFTGQIPGAMQGWVCDHDDYGRPIDVQFYATNVNPTGRSCIDFGGGPACLMGYTTANLLREQAVANNCGSSAYHGFQWNLPAELQTGSHLVYNVAVNYPPGANGQLNGSPLALSGNPIPTTVQQTNISRPGHDTDFVVGDQWQITVTGAPNKPVAVSGITNGQSWGSAYKGQTDATGQFLLSGQHQLAVVASWSESWSVDGVKAGRTLNFVVETGTTIPPGARVIYDQSKIPMTNTTDFWNPGVSTELVGTPFFMYSRPSTPKLISQPLEGVSDPYSLPNGHFLPTAGSAGITVNALDPNSGTYEIPFIIPWYDPPPNPLWADGHHNTLRYRMNLRVPYLAQTNARNIPYGFGVFRFKDRSTGCGFWSTAEFFDIRRDGMAGYENIHWDGGAKIWIVGDNIGDHPMYVSREPDSDPFITTAFTSWRTYDFSISTLQFLKTVRDLNRLQRDVNNCLSLACQSDPVCKAACQVRGITPLAGGEVKPMMSEDLRDYDLNHASLDTEIARLMPIDPAQGAMMSVEIQNWQTFTEQKTPTITGSFEGIAGGIATGWACWVGQEAPTDVRVYAYSAGGTASFLGHAIADVASEPAVVNACHGATAGHRFSLDLTSSLGVVQGQRVVVYAVPGNLDWADPGLFTGQSPDPKNPAGLVPATLTLPNSSGLDYIVLSNATTTATVHQTNISRPGHEIDFIVGDSWQITVTGAPNQPVAVSGSTNGTPWGPVVKGQTDPATGKYLLNGTMDSTVVAKWSETWSVGGVAASPALNFQVGPPTVQQANISRMGHDTDFVVGDQRQITVTGTTNKPVTVSGSTNGIPWGPFVKGQTDPTTGKFLANGTMDSTVLGSSSETWRVDGVQAGPNLYFVVETGTTIPPGARVFYDQSKRPMTTTTAFWHYGVISEPTDTPFFMYPVTATPTSISAPLDGVPDPYSLPYGHFLPTTGSAGFTTNTRDPHIGTGEIPFIIPWYDPPAAPLWKDGRNNTLRYRLNLRLPYLAQTDGTNIPYGFGVFRFRDRSQGQEFWYTAEFFDIRPSMAGAAYETISFDGWSYGAKIWAIGENIGDHPLYLSREPDSDPFIATAFTTWRTFDFSISTLQFLKAVRDVNRRQREVNTCLTMGCQNMTVVPVGSAVKPMMSEDLRDYDLNLASLDAEIARVPPNDPAQGAMMSVEIQNWQTFTEQRTPPIAGSFEGITGGIASGWACWVGQEAPTDVRVYAYSAGGTASFLGHAIADLASEPAVVNACYGATAGHRFSLDLTSSLGVVQGQRVVVYAVPGNLDWADPGLFTGQSPDPKNPAGLVPATLTLPNSSGKFDIVWGNGTAACTPSPFNATVDRANYLIGETPVYAIHGASPSTGILWSSFRNKTLVGQANMNYAQTTDAQGNWSAVGPPWTAADSGLWTKQASICESMATVSFTVNNQPTTVSACAPAASPCPTQTITLPALAMLSGTAADDGLPYGTLSTTWTMVSAPAGGQVIFASTYTTSTNAQFSAAGAYVLRLSCDDGSLQATDEVTVTVQPAPSSVLLDDFDGLSAPSPWYSLLGFEFPATQGTFTLGPGHAGKGIHLSFQNAGASAYINATRSFDTPVSAWGAAMWVRHPAGTDLILRILDSQGQMHQYRRPRPLGVTDSSAWYRQTVHFGASLEHWGGPNDGVVHQPVVALMVVATSHTPALQVGYLDFDDVALLTSPPTLLMDAGAGTPRPTSAYDWQKGLGAFIRFSGDDPQLDIMKSAGFQWLRTDLFWSHVEQQVGVYDFSEFDAKVAALEARGLRPLFILAYGNPLITGAEATAPTTPTQMTAYANFASAAAKHYQGRGFRYEVWNEPNAPYSWNPPNAALYSQLFNQTLAAMRAQDPQAEIMTAAMDEGQFLSDALTGMTGAPNAVGIHPYRPSPETYTDDLPFAQAIVSARMPSNPPFWISEWGYSSTWYGNGKTPAARAEQARRLTRQYLTEWALGSRFHITYDLRDDGSDGADEVQNYGLLNTDNSDKPAMTAVRTLVNMARAHFPRGAMATPLGSLHALRFSGSGETGLALWLDDQETQPLTVQFAQTPLRAIDYLGQTVTVGNAAGTPFVSVTNAPLYVTFAGADPAPAPDSDPGPAFNNVSAVVYVTSATITWRSTRPITSKADYGLTASYAQSAQDATLTTSHRLDLTGLAPGIVHYRVSGTDPLGVPFQDATDRQLAIPIPGALYQCLRTFYVSNAGNDSNAGTSPALAFLTLHHGANLPGLQGGDCVIALPGTYNETLSPTTGGSGDTQSGYVVFKSQIPHAAKIIAPSVPDAIGNRFAVYFGVNYLILDGFDVQGVPNNPTMAITSYQAHHHKFLNNLVHDSGGGGIGCGLGDYYTIQGNIVHDTAQINPAQMSGIGIYEARAISDNAPGFHNVITQNISYCNIIGNVAAIANNHSDGNGIIIDDFHNSQTGDLTWKNHNYPYQTLIENNLCVNNGGKGILLYESDNVTIRNNTAYHNNTDPQNLSGNYGELANITGSHNSWINNLAYADLAAQPAGHAIIDAGNIGTAGYTNAGVEWHNNLTFDGFAGQAALDLRNSASAVTPANGNLLGADPRLMNPSTDAAVWNFHPSLLSPANSAGTAVHADVDLANAPRLSGSADIGAYGHSTALPPIPNTVEGNLETVASVITGWAGDSYAPSVSITVELYLDGPRGSGTSISGVITQVLRSDVNQARGMTGNHGFAVNLPVQFQDGQSHQVYAYAVAVDGSLGALNGSPMSAVIPLPSEYPTAVLDTPADGSSVSGAISLSGWALDSETAIGNISVFIDGISVGQASYGIPRLDVCSQPPWAGSPGCPNVGFHFNLDTAALAPGSHRIEVRATDTDTAPHTGHEQRDISVGPWTSLQNASFQPIRAVNTHAVPVNNPAFNNNLNYSYAPSIIYENGSYNMFFCGLSPNKASTTLGAEGNSWDAIWHTTSVDGTSWSSPSVKLLAGAHNGTDQAACDPSVVYFNGYYYMYYGSAYISGPPQYTQTIIQVARASQIDGPYLTYTQRGTWEQTPLDPQVLIGPLRPRTGGRSTYGAGQPAVIAKSNQLYMWYVDDTVEGSLSGQPVYFLKSSDPVHWSPGLTSMTNIRSRSSVSVQYDPGGQKFVMTTILNGQEAGAVLAISNSLDGSAWTPFQVVWDHSVFPGYSHNVGVSSDHSGNLRPGPALVGFGTTVGLSGQYAENPVLQADLYGSWLLSLTATNQPPTVKACAPAVSPCPTQPVTLPAQATLTGSASDADHLPYNILSTTWSMVSAPNGGQVIFSSTYTTSANAQFSTPGSYVLRLTADDGQLTTASDITVTVHGTPNLALNKSASVLTALSGNTITFTLNYHNIGNDSAVNAVISDTVPSGTTLVPGSISQGGTNNSGLIQWSPGALAAGAAGSVNFQVQVN